LRFAEIAHLQIESRLHLPVGIFRETDRTGFGDAFQTGGYIDAVAHQIAIALLHHIAKMDANSKLNAALRRKARIALDHAVLDLDGAANGIDHAAELDEAPVAGAFDHATVMDTDGRGDQIAPERPQPSQRTFLVAAREAAEADHVSGKDSGKLALFGH
jgi:hypothetical protein